MSSRVKSALGALAAVLLGIAITVETVLLVSPPWRTPIAARLLPGTALCPQVAHLEDVAVTIKIQVNGEDVSYGSGVLFTRGDRTFVWTAGHVVSHMEPGFKGRVIVVRRKIVAGVENGHEELLARVLRFSDPNTGEDLSLLELIEHNVTKDSVKFYLDKELPPLGIELIHIGSFFGPEGDGSVSTGVLSAHGRWQSNTYFDQTSVVAVPGSSGGGVFLLDGRYIGMLVRASGPTINLIVPIRRMIAWSRAAGVEWALNPSVPVPSIVEPQFEKTN